MTINIFGYIISIQVASEIDEKGQIYLLEMCPFIAFQREENFSNGGNEHKLSVDFNNNNINKNNNNKGFIVTQGHIRGKRIKMIR